MSSQGNTVLNLIMAVKGAESLNHINSKIRELNNNLVNISQGKNISSFNELSRHSGVIDDLTTQSNALKRANNDLTTSMSQSRGRMGGYTTSLNAVRNKMVELSSESSSLDSKLSSLGKKRSTLLQGTEARRRELDSMIRPRDVIQQTQRGVPVVSPLDAIAGKYGIDRTKGKGFSTDFFKQQSSGLTDALEKARQKQADFDASYSAKERSYLQYKQGLQATDDKIAKTEAERLQVQGRLNTFVDRERSLKTRLSDESKKYASMSKDRMSNRDKLRELVNQRSEEGMTHRSNVRNIHDRVMRERQAAQNIKRDIVDAKSAMREFTAEIGSAIYFAGRLEKIFADSLKSLTNLKLAQSLSMGATNSIDAFRATMFGANVADVGAIAKELARTPYATQFGSNMQELIAYGKMFGANPQQSLPIFSGMKTMFGSATMNELMNSAIATSAASSFNFSGWSSIMVQNIIPQMQTLGVRLGTVNSLMGGLSNLGMGPFAAFGLNPLMTLASGSGTKEQKKAEAKILGSTGVFKSLVKDVGIYGALEELSKGLQKFSKDEQLKLMNTLFGGMGTGVGSALVNKENLKTFQNLEAQLLSPAFGRYQVSSAASLTPYMYEQVGSSMSNLKVSIVDLISETTGFRDSISGINVLLGGLLSGLKAIKEFSSGSAFGKITSTVASWSIAAATAFQLGTRIPIYYERIVGMKRSLDATGERVTGVGATAGFSLFSLFKKKDIARGNVEAATGAAAGTAATAGASLTTLSAISGGIVALLAVATMIRGSIDNYFKEKTTQALADRSAYETAIMKLRSGQELLASDRTALMKAFGVITDEELKKKIEEFYKLMNKPTEKEKTIKQEVHITIDSDNALSEKAEDNVVQAFRDVMMNINRNVVFN